MPPLIPVRLRTVALVAAAAAWGITVVVGMLVAGQRYSDPLDRTLARQVHATVGNGNGLAVFLLVPTDTGVIAAAAVVLIAIAIVRRRWDVVLLAATTPAICVGITELVLKPLFARRLNGQFSYPSGHAVAAIAVYTVAIMALVSAASRLRRCCAAAGWILLAAIVFAGLVGMNCHYPTDTIGGVLLAVGVVLPCAVLTDTLGNAVPTPRSSSRSARNRAEGREVLSPDRGTT